MKRVQFDKTLLLEFLVLAMILTIMVSIMVLHVSQIPVVYYGPAGTCIKVVSPNPDHNCHNLPEQYRTVGK